MATLILLRHAKSDWPDGVADAERPLSARGRADAAAVGTWLAEHVPEPDAVLCSPSRRTRQTWELLAARLPAAPAARLDARIYDASVRDLLAVVRALPAEVDVALLIGHNPGVQKLTLELAKASGGDALRRAGEKFPTSGLAVLDVGSDRHGWDSLRPGAGVLTAFEVPRG